MLCRNLLFTWICHGKTWNISQLHKCDTTGLVLLLFCFDEWKYSHSAKPSFIYWHSQPRQVRPNKSSIFLHRLQRCQITVLLLFLLMLHHTDARCNYTPIKHYWNQPIVCLLSNHSILNTLNHNSRVILSWWRKQDCCAGLPETHCQSTAWTNNQLSTVPSICHWATKECVHCNYTHAEKFNPLFFPLEYIELLV